MTQLAAAAIAAAAAATGRRGGHRLIRYLWSAADLGAHRHSRLPSLEEEEEAEEGKELLPLAQKCDLPNLCFSTGGSRPKSGSQRCFDWVVTFFFSLRDYKIYMYLSRKLSFLQDTQVNSTISRIYMQDVTESGPAV